MNIPSTTQRVKLNTSPEINRWIDQKTEDSIIYYAAHPHKISARLKELNQEWDIDRALETNAAIASITSVMLGILVSRKWFFVPAVVGGFLLNHAIKGWCPPLPLYRRMGVRTQTEIERERYALKALRGDFSQVSGSNNPGSNNSESIIEDVSLIVVQPQ
jgi:hypothetical protein